MKRRSVTADLERAFVSAMVTSDAFLAGAAPLLSRPQDLDLLPSPHLRRVAAWCAAHQGRYGSAPGKGIATTYQDWVSHDAPPDDDAEAVNDFLEGLSQEFDDKAKGDEPVLNVPHLLDGLAKYVTLKRAGRLAEEVEEKVRRGDVNGLLEAVASFSSAALHGGKGYDPTQDRDAMDRAFADPPESLIRFHGPAADFFGRSVSRGGLVGGLGSDKRGKSWWANDLAVRGLRSRRRVAVFSVGDLTEAELSMRFWARASSVPFDPKYLNQKVKYPQKITVDKSAKVWKPRVTTVDREFDAVLSPQIAWDEMVKFRRRNRWADGDTMVRFSAHPTKSISVSGIDAILSAWEQKDGLAFDILIFDYEGLLLAENNRLDTRDQINEVWEGMRRMAQERNACIITPSQANAAAYNAHVLGPTNFSEDKRKLAHCTAFMGINQTPAEKAIGVQRWNFFRKRGEACDENLCLYVAQFLPLGAAMVCSAM